ncbi:MAG: helical backbone metal receptor [Proteobacteria bacterium]|nr:helical backbone metal receptor [Pseudomonadota bacterium]
MQLKPLLHVLLVAVFATVASAVVARWSAGSGPVPAREQSVQRIVSLSPPITETLFALGVGSAVVGRSRFCSQPREVRSIPPAGTGLRPAIEALVRMRPTLILVEDNVQTQYDALKRVAPTELLRWLDVEDIIASVRRLGELTGRSAAADSLAGQFERRLRGTAPASGLRVLLAFAHDPGQLKRIFYLKAESIHGAVLHAAGARNAVPKGQTGVPQLSLEAVVRLDPDIIILLSADDNLADAARRQLVRDWARLGSVEAVKHGRIAVLNGSWMFGTGPRILELIDRLAEQIARYEAEPRAK